MKTWHLFTQVVLVLRDKFCVTKQAILSVQGKVAIIFGGNSQMIRINRHNRAIFRQILTRDEVENHDPTSPVDVIV